MNSPVQQIKERLSIEEVVSSYIKLEKAGANLKAKCPFHNEKTPSFFISPGRGSYYCFGCGAGGDIFTFVEEFEGLDFRGALKLLAEKAGVKLEQYNPKVEDEKEKLYRIMEEATTYFENNLKENAEVLAYLRTRGLEERSIKDFRIGYAILDWRRLYDHLKAKGFSDVEIEKAGLAKKPEDRSRAMYDRFRGRIMFPIADSSGRIIAFSGRLFIDDGKGAKYLNSPETPIFNKSAVLYGLDRAKDSIRKNNFSILVEGQMDLVLSHQAGYKNTIATSGTALADSTISKEKIVTNLGLVRRLSSNIVLAFDADRAGFNAANRAGRIALSLGMDVKVAEMPEGVDPADLISDKISGGPDAWREVIKNSKHIIEFVLARVLRDSKGDMRKVGREIKSVILPFVDALESSIEKSHFLKKISDLSSIPGSALEDDLRKIPIQTEEVIESGGEQVLKNEVVKFRKDYILRKLLGIILWQRTLKEQILDTDGILKEIGQILNVAGNEVLEKVKENKDDLIFEAEVFYEGLPAQTGDINVKKDVEELLRNLKEESLKEELAGKMRELNLAEQAGDKERSSQILKECQEINKKIHENKK
ncbi:DNA primase [Candidatus Nomurabacteria bacterium RIFCSPLOWO2_01_FULL_39_18]|uniref:DNA primase n=1 Tax=Candidatus Nomurabacteria bacterium RIFCSPHIGHO2_01_FULL_40_24b TaxID=1801739 RepID=A0A1F6V9S1_9BACT|nr:MAG: DNA primase [Candidatus Nomurabacteria bacterium RIFCSPHIGHO2_01_FULL_40_24b]OGI90605.1 MAG: DNA primase [Candidatus Nomurabacteria bacterium RIFCSPLOWO2_01_FULL_39_18]